jgi:hypothetical protein
MKISTLTVEQVVISFVTFMFNLMYFSTKSYSQIGQFTILQVAMFLTQSFASQAILLKIRENNLIETFTYPLLQTIKLSVKFSIPAIILAILLVLHTQFSMEIFIWVLVIPIYTLYDVLRRQIAFIYSDLKSLKVNLFHATLFVLFGLLFLLKLTRFSSLLILIALLINYLSYIIIFSSRNHLVGLTKQMSSRSWIKEYHWSQQDLAITLSLTLVPYFFLPIIDSSTAGEYRLSIIYATSIMTTIQSVVINLHFFDSLNKKWLNRHNLIFFLAFAGYFLNIVIYEVFVILLDLRRINILILSLAAFVTYSNFCLSYLKLRTGKDHSLQLREIVRFWLYFGLINLSPLFVNLLVDL